MRLGFEKTNQSYISYIGSEYRAHPRLRPTPPSGVAARWPTYAGYNLAKQQQKCDKKCKFGHHITANEYFVLQQIHHS